MLQACDPYEWMHDYNTYDWYVKNYTGQTLSLAFPPLKNRHNSRVLDVSPGDSILFCGTSPYRSENILPHFTLFKELLADLDDDLCVYVSSKDGTLLAEWKYSEKDFSPKQFFNEESWQYYEKTDNKKRITATWVVEILPEDIITD